MLLFVLCALMSSIHRTDINARSILTKTSGALKRFDYSLNPYSGCSFGCSYCYAAFFARTTELQDSWGQWISPKTNAPQLLKSEMTSRLHDGAWVYMSSVTDPYVPIERETLLTRACIELMAQRPHIVLVVQTRSPLVTRDIDVLQQLHNVQVNMSITTDNDNIRKAFEPLCPSIQRRLQAVQKLEQAGIRTCVTLSPLLPVVHVDSFADRLLQTGAKHFAVDFFEVSRGRFVSGTGEEARLVAKKMNWTEAVYQTTVQQLRTRLPELVEGEPGFHFRGDVHTSQELTLFS